MGTRALTVVQDEAGNELITMYRQMDGYPAGHGAELAEFLSGFSIVNGLSGGQPNRIANGMGCLAAQLIAHFKTRPGGIYLYPPKTRDCGEEYIYTVKAAEATGGAIFKRLRLIVQAGSMTFFGLPGTKQRNMPIIYDGPPEEFGDGAGARLAKVILNDFIESQKGGTA